MVSHTHESYAREFKHKSNYLGQTHIIAIQTQFQTFWAQNPKLKPKLKTDQKPAIFLLELYHLCGKEGTYVLVLFLHFAVYPRYFSCAREISIILSIILRFPEFSCFRHVSVKS